MREKSKLSLLIFSFVTCGYAGLFSGCRLVWRRHYAVLYLLQRWRDGEETKGDRAASLAAALLYTYAGR